MTNQLDHERSTGRVGGRSKVVLIVPNMAGISGADSDFADQRLRAMREVFPDMELFFLSGGTATRWNRFVRNPRIHIHPLRIMGQGGAEDNTITTQLRDLTQRIQEGKFAFHVHDEKFCMNTFSSSPSYHQSSLRIKLGNPRSGS